MFCATPPDWTDVPPTHLPVACAPLAKHAIPVWTNRRWKELSNDGQPLQFLSVESGRRLRSWLADSGPPPPADSDGTSSGPTTPLDGRPATGGLATMSATDARGSRGARLTLDFAFPSGTLTFELTKTLAPIFINHKGHRQIVDSYTFAVITTVPRDGAAESKSGPEKAPRPSPSLQRTALEKRRHEGAPPWSDKLLSAGSSPPLSLHFLRDGSVTHSTTPSLDATEDRRPLNVQALLDGTDWSRTPLGPRDAWPASLRVMSAFMPSSALTAVNFVMFHPHAASLWWGKERCVIYNQRYADVSSGVLGVADASSFRAIRERSASPAASCGQVGLALSPR